MVREEMCHPVLAVSSKCQLKIANDGNDNGRDARDRSAWLVCLCVVPRYLLLYSINVILWKDNLCSLGSWIDTAPKFRNIEPRANIEDRDFYFSECSPASPPPLK